MAEDPTTTPAVAGEIVSGEGSAMGFTEAGTFFHANIPRLSGLDTYSFPSFPILIYVPFIERPVERPCA